MKKRNKKIKENIITVGPLTVDLNQTLIQEQPKGSEFEKLMYKIWCRHEDEKGAVIEMKIKKDDK